MNIGALSLVIKHVQYKIENVSGTVAILFNCEYTMLDQMQVEQVLNKWSHELELVSDNPSDFRCFNCTFCILKG